MSYRAVFSGTYGLLAVALTATQGLSVPANPQRPFTATTCEQAQERFEEAKAGSPLISEDENEEVRRAAFAQLEQLCDGVAAPSQSDGTETE